MSRTALTAQLARCIEQIDIDYSFSRLDGMRQAPGNPMEIEIRRFGDAFAFLIKAWPDFWYGNKVLGIEPTSLNNLDEIVDFFARRELGFRFEIIPGRMSSDLAIRLYKLGFCQMDFNTAVYGQPSSARATFQDRRVRVRETRADEEDLFLDLYQDGFGLPRMTGDERRAVRAWLDQARNSLYLCCAEIDNTPVAVGILYLNGGLGLLADATCLPEYRGRGCHAALINHRVVQAAERGCGLLASFVEFGSVSHRNLEKAGLRVAYTKAMWWKAE